MGKDKKRDNGWRVPSTAHAFLKSVDCPFQYVAFEIDINAREDDVGAPVTVPTGHLRNQASTRYRRLMRSVIRPISRC